MALTFMQVAVLHGQESSTVVAKLGEQTITDRDVDFHLGRAAVENANALNDLPPAVMQSAIYLIAQQRQALQTLRSKKLAYGRDEVERWLEENGQPPSGEKRTPAELIREQARQAGITESNLRDHLAFRLSWQGFLKQQLTDANVSKHFDNQPKRFNGTRFKVTIVDVASAAGKSDRREQLARTLTKLRSQMMSGELQWNEVATALQKTDAMQGKIDQIRVRENLWARGTGDLEPSIITALMKMEPVAYSDPIHTPTGVHLVQLLEVEAGAKELTDVRDEVRAHMLLYLLDHLARQSESQLPLKAID